MVRPRSSECFINVYCAGVAMNCAALIWVDVVKSETAFILL